MARSRSTRRRFLASAPAGAAALLARPGAGATWTDGEQANVKLVTAFCDAWSTRDLSRVLPYLSDDCVYRMTETTPPATGHEGVTTRLKASIERSERVQFRILDTFASGPIVITHRIDRFVSARPLTWERVGVFFVKDGRIKEWSDYTIRVER